MVGQKYFKGGKRAFRGTKYNKINNNSENFGEGARLLSGGEGGHSPCIKLQLF